MADGIAGIQARIQEIQQRFAPQPASTTSTTAAGTQTFAEMLSAAASLGSDGTGDDATAASPLSALLTGLTGTGTGTGTTGLSGLLVPNTGNAVGDLSSYGGSDKTRQFVQSALAQAGDPYVWGASASPLDPDPKAFDCCIAEGSLVTTARGCIPIEDVAPGDLVGSWGNDGGFEYRKVTTGLDQGEQPVFRLRTRNRSVVATANHPFLVLCRKPRRRIGVPVEWWVEWRRLDEMQRGDIVVTLDHLDGAGERLALPDGTPIDADVAWLLGLFVGDGTVRANDVRVCVFGSTRDRARQIIEQTWKVAADPHPTAGLLVRRNGSLSRCLGGVLGEYSARDKRVPSLVWDFETPLINAFLDGYAAADGHTDRRGYRAYHSASRRLVAEVRMLHIMLGDSVSNLTTTKRVRPIVIKGKTVKNALPLHSFQWYPASKRRGQVIKDNLGARRAVPDPRFSVERVLCIEPAGSARTWDLEIEGSHNFIVDGVVVHNSELTKWAAQRAGVDLPDGSWLQYLQLKQQGATIPVAQALQTPGALLFSFSHEPTPGGGRPSQAHVAISLGNGRTIEARGRSYGVGSFDAGNRFEYAAVIPGLAA